MPKKKIRFRYKWWIYWCSPNKLKVKPCKISCLLSWCEKCSLWIWRVLSFRSKLCGGNCTRTRKVCFTNPERQFETPDPCWKWRVQTFQFRSQLYNICWKSRTEIMEQPARASKVKSAAAPWPQYTVILQKSAAVLKLTAGNIYTACGTNTEAHCLQKHHTFSKLVQLFTLSWVTPQWKNHRVLYRLNTSSEFYRMFLRTLNSVRHWAMRQNR